MRNQESCAIVSPVPEGQSSRPLTILGVGQSVGTNKERCSAVFEGSGF